MNYKNAFRCKKCPESNKENGCPVWWEMILTNEETGVQKVEKGCGYQMMPALMVKLSKQAMHTTYAAYDMRNKVVKNVGKVIQAVGDKLQLPDLEITDDDIILIEENTGEEKDGIS